MKKGAREGREVVTMQEEALQVVLAKVAEGGGQALYLIVRDVERVQLR